jgi:type VI secretion system protein ImpG
MLPLLPHYERELALLQEEAGSFARRYPRIAGALAGAHAAVPDPHAQRLVQAFALLTARSHKRLDDDVPLFTESLLEQLYPQALRPFPACSIACFDLGTAARWSDRALELPRGTLLATRAARGVACRFATTAPVQLLPLRVAAARFSPLLDVPAGTPLPPPATALLSLRLALGPAVANWAALGVQHVRLFLDGDPSLVALLRETLLTKAVAVLAPTSQAGPWVSDTAALPRPVGLEDDEALLPTAPRDDAAGRLLSELLAFPEKFNFLDLPLPEAALQAEGRELELHYVLSGLGRDGEAARLLDLVAPAHFVTGCVPVVNLFSKMAEPIRLTHTRPSYTVLPDGGAAACHEVHAVTRVWRSRRTAQGLAVQEIPPLYGLRHEALLRDGTGPCAGWWTWRNDAMAARSPGHETEIGLADPALDPAAPQEDTLSVEVLATQRDLPSRLSIGNPGGDLWLAEAGSDGLRDAWQEIRLLRRPTPPQRLDRREALWQLVSRLGLHQQSLSAGGLQALQALLRQHDLTRGAASQRLLAGLAGIEFQPSRVRVAGGPYGATVQGTEIRLSVEARHFTGMGLFLFAQVLARCLGRMAPLNGFTQLRLVCARTGEPLLSCPPRNGDGPLA